MLLKGYKPFEIPVNYRSRSYSEGKKVTFVQDPLLWIRANFKFRVVSPFTFEFQQMMAAATGKLVLPTATTGSTTAARVTQQPQSIESGSVETRDRSVEAKK